MLLTALVTMAVIGGAGTTLGPGARIDMPPVVVLDRSLRATTGELVSLRDGAVTVKTAGNEVTIERAFAVVSAPLWGPERDWPGLPREDALEAGLVTVELTDGSRLRGDLLAGKGDGLVLVHKRLGKVEVPLDALTALTVHGSVPDGRGGASRRARSDVVLLANGDRLEGFIDSIAPAKGIAGAGGMGLAVTIERESDKTRTVVPLERVAWVALNGGAATKPGALVWLSGSDGERTATVEFSVEKGGREARLVRAKGALASRMDAARVEGAVFEPSAAVSLASCAVNGGTAEVGQVEQPLGMRDLTIPEPGATGWVLPAGAAHITGWAVLPEECRRWGDCRVTITVSQEPQGRAGEGAGGRPVVEFTLNGAQPIVAIDAELPTAGKVPASLWVTVSEGKNGPVQDRVVLRRVLIGFEKRSAGLALPVRASAP